VKECLEACDDRVTSLTSALKEADRLAAQPELRRNVLMLRAAHPERREATVGAIWGSFGKRNAARFVIHRVAVVQEWRNAARAAEGDHTSQVAKRLWAALRDAAWERASRGAAGGRELVFSLSDVTCVSSYGQYWRTMWLQAGAPLPERATEERVTPEEYVEKEWECGMGSSRRTKWKMGSPLYTLK